MVPLRLVRPHHPSLGQGYRPAEDGVAQFVREGAILSVQVSNPAGGGTPQTARGLIDTGASISGIRPAVARAAGLIQTGTASISGVTGTEKRPIYAAGVSLPEYGLSFDAVEVAGIELPQEGVNFLLGRDILKNTTLTVHGRSGEFSLTDGEGVDVTTLAAGLGITAAAAALLLFLTGAFK